MNREEKNRDQRQHLTLLQALSMPRVLLLCTIYFTVAVGSNCFGAYAPQIVKDRFAGADNLQVGLLTALPNIATMICMIIVGVHSDRTGERRWHVAGTAFLAATGWVIAARCQTPWLSLLGLILAQMGMLSMLAPFWALPTSFLSGVAAAGGIALINSIGNLGGFVGPNIFSFVKDKRGDFADAMLVVALILFVGGCLALRARHDATLEDPHGDARAD